jgi:hypothetical protein
VGEGYGGVPGLWQAVRGVDGERHSHEAVQRDLRLFGRSD